MSSVTYQRQSEINVKLKRKNPIGRDYFGTSKEIAELRMDNVIVFLALGAEI